MACGAFESVDRTSDVVRIEPDMELPDPELHRLYEKERRIYSELYEATAPRMHRLEDLGRS